MDDVGMLYVPLGIFYGQLYILWQFGTFLVMWYMFFPIFVCCTNNIWQPWSAHPSVQQEQAFALWLVEA
jgi:hypothetical protein